VALATRACPGCKSESAPRQLFPKGNWIYAACPDCGLVHLDPVPTPEESAALYGASYFAGGGLGEYIDYAGDEELHRVNARRQLARIARVRPDGPGELLDFGCAYGFFADEARRAGWKVEGVEISDVAARNARERFGLTVYPDLGTAIASNGAGVFDVVTFLQVLAQLPRPADALASAHALLRRGGLLVVETANRASPVARLLGRHWHLLAPPASISLFTPETLDGLLGRCGFERVALFPTRKAVTVGLVANSLERTYGRVLAPLGSMGRSRALRERIVRYPFADLMTVVAERR
jgi:SAM-dependent methyltransferase